MNHRVLMLANRPPVQQQVPTSMSPILCRQLAELQSKASAHLGFRRNPLVLRNVQYVQAPECDQMSQELGPLTAPRTLVHSGVPLEEDRDPAENSHSRAAAYEG